MLYLDTSAFLKVLVAEEHSKALRHALRSTDAWSSTLLAVEAHRPHSALESPFRKWMSASAQ